MSLLTNMLGIGILESKIDHPNATYALHKAVSLNSFSSENEVH